MSDIAEPEKQPESLDQPIAVTKKRSVLHVVLGGVLMGTADVVPGVSGGTMLVATGLYDNFISSVANFTRLRFSKATILFLVLLGVGDVSAILTLSSVVEWGLTHHQHIMFALFIGLTLGGVPILWREIHPIQVSGIAGIVVGFLVMIAISFALRELNLPFNFAVLLIAGFIASSAMVLPGISGAYLLLMMGLYSPILEGLSRFKEGLRSMDIALVFEVGVSVVLPVALGILCGVAFLSNTIKMVLRRYHEPTVGILMGLLLGSVISLYPFRAPGPKDLFEHAAPATPASILLVLTCVVSGFLITTAIGRMDREVENENSEIA